jgi:hypothetical protein
MAPTASKCLHRTPWSRKDILEMLGVGSTDIWDYHGTIVTLRPTFLMRIDSRSFKLK